MVTISAPTLAQLKAEIAAEVLFRGLGMISCRVYRLPGDSANQGHRAADLEFERSEA